MISNVSFGGNFRKFPRMSLQILFAGCVCGAHAQLCQRENQSKLERHRGTSGMRIRTRARAVVSSPRLRRVSREPSSFDFAFLRRLARFFVITSRTQPWTTSPDGSKKEAGSQRFVLLI